MDMATIDDLERRVRTVEEELAGERHVSRFQVEQATRNSEVLHAVRSDIATVRSELGTVTSRVDLLTGEMVSVKATLTMHGRALDVLQQDVRQIRQEVGQINQRLDAMERNIAAILAAVAPGGQPPG
jgi:chromosome segregation ATPase